MHTHKKKYRKQAVSSSFLHRFCVIQRFFLFAMYPSMYSINQKGFETIKFPLKNDHLMKAWEYTTKIVEINCTTIL